jgi:regulatory protein
VSGEHEAASAKAVSLAYRYLGKRERTTRELRSHLAARDVEEAVAEEAIAELREQGYVDDGRYARLFVEDKRRLEGWGRDRIVRALHERGLEHDVIDDAISGFDAADELAQALELLRRRCPEPPVERRERERALGILLRKGYEPELALEALGVHARFARGCARYYDDQ